MTFVKGIYTKDFHNFIEYFVYPKSSFFNPSKQNFEAQQCRLTCMRTSENFINETSDFMSSAYGMLVRREKFDDDTLACFDMFLLFSSM